MRFPFVKIRRLSSGTEVLESRVLASDLAEALTIFRPAKDTYVCSEASFKAGLPRALSQGMCKSCGQRPAVLAYGHETGRCAKCQAVVHREQQERSVKARYRVIDPLPPATLRECREHLNREMEKGMKAGRPKSSLVKARGAPLDLTREPGE